MLYLVNINPQYANVYITTAQYKITKNAITIDLEIMFNTEIFKPMRGVMQNDK